MPLISVPPKTLAPVPAPNPWGPMVGPVPGGARVSLHATRTRFLLGEDVRVTFRLENAGTSPFRYNVGSDYRGAPRALRFVVTAVDENGRMVADPHPNANCMGGLGVEPTLKPGEKWEETISLTPYLRFDRPGTYTVRVRHDLGWAATSARPVPEATITLTLAAPTPQQAQAVVAEIAHQRRQTADDDQKPRYDSCRYLPYLAPLAERARQGETDAAFAIGDIASPGATPVLVELAQKGNEKVALEAVRVLNHRLPPGKFTTPTWDENGQRAYLSKTAWRASDAGLVRSCARALLSRPGVSPDMAGQAARLLAAVGTPDDLPFVTRALSRALARDRGNLGGSAETVFLMEAANALLSRGAVPHGQTPRTLGESALWLLSHKTNLPQIPRDVRLYASLLASPLSRLHGLALDTLLESGVLRPLPAPLAAVVRRALPTCLADNDPSVVMSACPVAVGLRTSENGPLLLRRLAENRVDVLHTPLTEAASACTGRDRALEVWADRLTDAKSEFDARAALFAVFQTSGWDNGETSSPAQARGLQTAWRTFIAIHRDELRAGKTWHLSAPEYRADLFPSGVALLPRESGEAVPPHRVQ